MTPSELKYQVENKRVEPYFFTRQTMRFFGDTMANYGVRSATVDTHTQQDVDVWELYRKRPVKHGLQKSAYFDKKTFKQVHAKI